MSKKTFILRVHSTAGLISGIFILLLSLSGAALVFHEELDSLQYPAVKPISNLPVLPVDSCYHALQKNYPAAMISNCHIAEGISMPFIFTAYEPGYKKGKEPMQVFIHPQTAAILKIRGGSNDINGNFMGWLSSLHSSFRLHKKGEWLLGVFAIVFMISLVTGTILYRKSVVDALLFRKIKLHQLIGVYALLFNLMMAFTGFWMQRYVFKKEFYQDNDYTPALKASPPLGFRVDSSLASARNKFPDFTGYVIYFAQSSKGKTAVYGSRSSNSFIHSKKFADVVYLDSTGNVAQTRFITEIDPADRHDIINSQLHSGKFGGWPVKLLYSLLGLTGAVLSITGFILSNKRKK